MSKRERFEMTANIVSGMVYAVVWDGTKEIVRLGLTDKANDGRHGLVLSSVPLEFKPK